MNEVGVLLLVEDELRFFILAIKFEYPIVPIYMGIVIRELVYLVMVS